MAEGRRVNIESNGQVIRFFLVQDLKQDIQKTEYCTRVNAGRICEIGHPVKCPVQNTVSVYQYQLFFIHPSFLPFRPLRQRQGTARF